MKIVKLDLLRPGVWKDKTGKVIEVTKDTINKIVDATKKFTYQDDTLPIVKGHPKEDDPAYGWVKKSNIAVDENGHLVATLSEDEFTDEAFVEDVKKKKFKNISIATRKDGSLRHIGFFGAKTTAINGLEPVQLAEEDDEIFLFDSYSFAENEESLAVELGDYEMNDYPFRTIRRMFTRLKTFLAEKYGAEEANKLFPDYELDETGEAPRIYKRVSNNMLYAEEELDKLIYSETNKDGNMDTIEKLKAQNEQLKQSVTQLKSDLENANNSLTQAQREKALNAAYQFCESDEMKKRISPAMKNKIAYLMVELEETGEFEFAETDGENETTAKAKAVETFKEILKGLPELELGEEVITGTSEDGLKGDRAIGEQIASFINN